jgi:uncharacterized membrane protein YhhN
VNVYAWVLLAALALTAVADWVAVATDRHEVESLAKPAFMVLLVSLAWLLRADTVPYGQFLLLGLVLCLVGDVALLGRTDRAFLIGLVAFLLGHLAYIAAFRRMPTDDPVWPAVALVAFVVGYAAWLFIRPILQRSRRDGIPLLLYAVVVGSMAALAWVTGQVVMAVGASFFLLSDAVLAYDRFESELAHGRLMVMVTYHVGQVLLVVGMLRC